LVLHSGNILVGIEKLREYMIFVDIFRYQKIKKKSS